MSEIEKIKNQFNSKLENTTDLENINLIKSELFGKNGIISNQFKALASKSEKDKKTFASELNNLKNDLLNIIEQKIEKIKIEEINKKLQNEKIDITLPERSFSIGKIHPVSQVIDEVTSIFSEIGFPLKKVPT